MAFTSDEQDLTRLIKRLDQGFADHIASLSNEERQAIIAWQSMDRSYERIQKAAATGTGSTRDRLLVQHLTNAIQRGTTPCDLVVWRGIRNSFAAFGLRRNQLGRLLDKDVPVKQFLAGSLAYSVALQFTQPPLGSGPVILRIRIPKCTQAIWVAGAGSPDKSLKQQYEILLPRGIRLHYSKIDRTRGIPIMHARVVSNK